MKINNPQILPEKIQELNNKIESFRTKASDSLITIFGKQVRKHFSSDYKSIKKQIVEQLKSQDAVPKQLKDRLTKKISLEDIDKALSYFTDSENNNKNNNEVYDEIVGNAPNYIHRHLHPNPQEHAKETTKDTTSINADNEILPPDYSQIAETSFNALQDLSKELHKDSDLYPGNEVFGGVRFNDIRPPKESVVKVSMNNWQQPIHANTVGKHYIASQGPMKTTANQFSIPAFFSMAMEQNSDTIVNLTNNTDARKSPNLQVEYWPATNDTITHNLGSQQLSVTTRNIEQHDGYKVITLQLKQEKAEPIYANVKTPSHSIASEKTVKVFHFPEWPDFGVPEGNQLEKFNQFTKALEDNQHSGRKIVHCRAGVGRTGTLIVLEQLRQGIRSGDITRKNLTSSIEQLVMEGRTDRGKAFVQAEAQLKMLFELGSAELEKMSPSKSSPSADEITKIPLKDIKLLLSSGQITTPEKTLKIEKNAWNKALKDLSTTELKELIFAGDGLMSPTEGYDKSVRDPALKIFAEKRVPELISEKGANGALNYLNTKTHYHEGTVLGDIARNLLANYNKSR